MEYKSPSTSGLGRLYSIIPHDHGVTITNSHWTLAIYWLPLQAKIPTYKMSIMF